MIDWVATAKQLYAADGGDGKRVLDLADKGKITAEQAAEIVGEK